MALSISSVSHVIFFHFYRTSAIPFFVGKKISIFSSIGERDSFVFRLNLENNGDHVTN